nr:hypothetical protein [uncultured Lacibacter sp.]
MKQIILVAVLLTTSSMLYAQKNEYLLIVFSGVYDKAAGCDNIVINEYKSETAKEASEQERMIRKKDMRASPYLIKPTDAYVIFKLEVPGSGSQTCSKYRLFKGKSIEECHTNMKKQLGSKADKVKVYYERRPLI